MEEAELPSECVERGSGVPPRPAGKWGYRQWLATQLLMVMAQAMAPIAFAMGTLRHDPGFNLSAAMMAAMLLCQVLLAVPLSRLGDRVGAMATLRVLVATRGVAFLVLAAAMAAGAPPTVMIALAACCGIPYGAIYSVLLSMLSDVVMADRLPRTLAFGLTVGELVSAAGPIVAAVIGGVWSPFAILFMALCSLSPLLFLSGADHASSQSSRTSMGGRISPAILVWMYCYFVGGMAVAAVEVGVVSTALRLGVDARYSAVFATVLGLAAVVGGSIFIILGRELSPLATVSLQFLSMSGSMMFYVSEYLWTAVVAAGFVGLCLPPLAAHYSLATKRLLPSGRRSEGFSLIRTSNGIGLVVASLLVAFANPKAIAVVLAAVFCTAIAAVLSTNRYMQSEMLRALE